MRVSIDEIMAFRPCGKWTRDRMLEVSGGRTEIDITELPDLGIKASDLVWLTAKILELRGQLDEYFLAAAIAERVLPIFERKFPDDIRPRSAIQAARLYAMGEISADDVKVAADAAAVDAAAYAVDAAAYAAVNAVAYVAYAAAYAAYDAVRAAYAAAYDAAAYDAVRAAYAADAERQAQREICRTFLENLGG